MNQVTDNKEKIQLIKDYCGNGLTTLEMQLFLYTCKRLYLDPMARQIHAVKRWNSLLKRESMTIQIGIDGYRLIADRTGKYAPGKAEEFKYDENKKLISATAYVMKMTNDGKWHEISATAYYDEYVGLTKAGVPNSMWNSKPHIMLGKCAESLALRKAFPAELSGVYTKEEMQQAENEGRIDEMLQDSENLIQEVKKEIVEDFLLKWEKTYDKCDLMEYIEKRSEYTKKSLEDTVTLLSNEEELFEKEFNSWYNKHRKAS